ncbi:MULTISPECIES: helix-turn-helix transcriptional regulator [Methylosinus]|uniref:AlpA family transcriptional regulator n=1 Tax=Methylosinus trichosporium (strain ATCC 35070 / NCIMB 11131 / UNIQEM 75 / OB3b) TaxID=595536 RepID=A0A2D2CW46_METT3|nr:MULTISPECIES: hypothetical protein [Methylosinus]ATQ66886.1 AlpA family transcriptional regulator [Methylosinus trichosporium OB3b]OBS54150.1 hypothetical protein A8B73_02660 [Methylosinus sp. 3S-1]
MADDDLIPKPKLAAEIGRSPRTIARWMADERLNFPKPIKIRERLFFRRSEWEAWKAWQIRKSIGEAV